MLCIDEQGQVFTTDHVTPSSLLVPHKRQVVAALHNIRLATNGQYPEIAKDLQIIYAFMGVSPDAMLPEQEVAMKN
jgi:hypothetical protein